MRNITTTERNRLSAAHANFYLRVNVRDSENNWRDLTNTGSVDYVDSVSWSASLDSATMTGSVTLKRERRGGFSLAPLLTGSSLNKDSHGAYAPLLDVGRGIQILTAVTAHGTAPVTGDWKEVFLGRITDIDFTSDPITLTIADIGVDIIDTTIEAVRTYGDAVGVAVETVVQSELDDNMGAGIVTLYVPVASTFTIYNTDTGTYSPDRGPLMDAIRALALQIGWDLRYKYDSSDVFRLTWYSPDRTKTVSDATIGPNEYLNVTRLAISNADIRNVVKVNFQDKNTGIVSSQTASDSGSIAEFGRRYMEIGEGTSTNINDATHALAMATAAVSDMSEPVAAQSIEQFYFWPVELGDLLTYSANGVHYDTDQQFGVVAYSHTLSATSHRTTIDVSGHVAGAYRQWLTTRNGEFTGQISNGPSPNIFPLVGESQAFEDATRDGMAWVQVAFEAETQSIDIYAVESSAANSPIPALSSSYLAYSLARQEGDKWSLDNVEYIVGIATRTLYYRKIIAFGLGKDQAEQGPTIVEEVQAVDVGVGPSGPPTAFAKATAGTTNRITWTNGDASAYTILFRNGIGIVLPAGVTAFIDTGLPSSVTYTYAIAHLKNGQTSAFAGGGSGGTVTPPSSDPIAPAWASGTPTPTGTNGVIFTWTADAASTEIAIEIATFVITGIFTELIVWTDPSHVPNGTYTDTSQANGTKYNARVRSKIGGLYYYSTQKTAMWGTPPMVAPKFVDGTPYFDGSSTDFNWTTASSAVVSLDLLVNGAVVYHTASSSWAQAGNTNISNATYGGKSAQLRANYAGGVTASSAIVRIPTHTGGL
ncbi:MAG: hypothetical protein ABI119_11050 [Gemmatimonadaceae bacterium]